MPIVARSQGKKFTFPDGTSQEEMGAAIDDYFAKQQPEKPQQAKFDPSGDLPPPFGFESPEPEQPEPEEPPSIGERIVGGLETAGAVIGGGLAGAAGQAVGAVEGIGREIIGGEFGTPEAAQRVAETAQKRASQFAAPAMPRTETGREMLGATAEALEPLAALPPVLGGQVGALPAMSARVAATRLARKIDIPLFKSEGVPNEALSKALKKQKLDIGDILDDVDNLPDKIPVGSADELVENIVKQKIATGSGNDFIAEKRLSAIPSTKKMQSGEFDPFFGLGKSKIIKDKLGADTVASGFKRGDVASAKGASNATRKQMRKMLNMHRAIFKNRRKVDEFRPSDIPGKILEDQYNFIRKKTDTFTNDLNRVAKNNLSKKNINFKNIEQGVIDDLSRLDIDLPEDVGRDIKSIQEFLNSKDAFVDSSIKIDRTSQRVIKDAVNLLVDGEAGNALKAHKLKRQLDTMLDFRKQSPRGLTDAGKKFAKSLRAKLNQEIRDIDADYAEINDNLTSAIGSMDDFQKAMKFDPIAQGGDKKIGQELRKLLSQYQARVPMENAVNKLDDVARKFGYESDIDVKELNRFATVLDNRFGSVADTSFQPKITTAIDLAKTARGRTGVDLAIELAEKGIKKGKDLFDEGAKEKAAYDNMLKLLERGK